MGTVKRPISVVTAVLQWAQLSVPCPYVSLSRLKVYRVGLSSEKFVRAYRALYKPKKL
jgi:hypothetical protein